MRVFHGLSDYQAGSFPIATIGTFDGVHLGHRQILSRLMELKNNYPEAETVIITFDPHPRKVLIQDAPPTKLLQTLNEKIDKLTNLGIDKLLIIPFTEDFSRLESQDFIKHVLVEGVRVRQLVIGYDHRFGKNRKGNLEELKTAGCDFHFDVIEIPAHQINESNVSSTQIRQALISGNVVLAEKYLGYPYSLTGTVVTGSQRGRTIGFPTANLAPANPDKLIPAGGVYAVQVTIQQDIFAGMLNIGYRPTFGDGGLSIEVHVLDFDGDLYGQDITISFLDHIRNEIKFPNIESLKAQLNLDKTQAQSIYKLRIKEPLRL